MNIIVVGLSHKTATVEIRERVAFSPNLIEKPLHELIALDDIIEGVIISTCNRVEIYATSRDIAGTHSTVSEPLRRYDMSPSWPLQRPATSVVW